MENKENLRNNMPASSFVATTVEFNEKMKEIYHHHPPPLTFSTQIARDTQPYRKTSESVINNLTVEREMSVQPSLLTTSYSPVLIPKQTQATQSTLNVPSSLETVPFSAQREQKDKPCHEQSTKKTYLEQFMFAVVFGIALISLALPFLSYFERSTDVKPEFSSSQRTKLLRNIGIVLSFIICFLLIVNYHLQKQLLNLTSQKKPKQSNNLVSLIFELILNVAILPNGYDILIEGSAFNGIYTYSLNTFFTILNIAKCYHVFKLALLKSIPSGKFLEYSNSLKLKYSIKQRPWSYIITIFFYVCFVSTLCLQIVEINFKSNKGSSGQYGYDTIQSTFWVIINTLLTVGFGDGYPYTQFGRVICIILAILGTVFIGILVVVFQNINEPTETEKEAVQQIRIKQFKLLSINLIKAAWKKNKKNCLSTYIQFELAKLEYLKDRQYIPSYLVLIFQLPTLFRNPTIKLLLDEVKKQKTKVTILEKLNTVHSLQKQLQSGEDNNQLLRRQIENKIETLLKLTKKMHLELQSIDSLQRISKPKLN